MKCSGLGFGSGGGVAWIAVAILAGAAVTVGGCSTLFPGGDDDDKTTPSVTDAGGVDGGPSAKDGGTTAVDSGSGAVFDGGPRPVVCPDGVSATNKPAAMPPAVDACTMSAPPWWDAGKAPAPTLKVETGVWDVKEGKFVPWSYGQWAPIHFGMRMGAGVWTALQVTLPGETADKLE